MDLTITFTTLATWARARFGHSDRAASLVEYALLVALIAVLCIGALRFLSGRISSGLSGTGDSIS
jgi:pilus assembly protein Flp/PilA